MLISWLNYADNVLTISDFYDPYLPAYCDSFYKYY